MHAVTVAPMSETLTIEIETGPARLDKALADACPDYSRSRLKALILAGDVSSNDKTLTDPSEKVRIGQEITITLPPLEAATPQAQDIPLDVVFEDEHLILINKPPGMVVHPAPGNPDGTLVNALLAHCGESLIGIGGVARPGIVHRIDKDTSGIMVAAKSDAAHEGLSHLFVAHDIERAYLAVIRGKPPMRKGRVEANIARSRHNRQKMAVVRIGGRVAATNYEVKHIYGDKNDAIASLVECRLETGRTHQIRVHMTHIGHPVVGDATYGRGMRLKGGKNAPEILKAFPRQALHARVLGFIHPITGEKLRFSVRLPSDMEELTTALEALD